MLVAFCARYTIRYVVSRPAFHAGNIPCEVGKWGRRSLCGHAGRGDLTISRGESFTVVDDGGGERREDEGEGEGESRRTSRPVQLQISLTLDYGVQCRSASNFAAVCRTTTTRTNRAKARSLNAPESECSQYRDTETQRLVQREAACVRFLLFC